MDIFFYLIRAILIMFLFGFNISKIKNKVIRISFLLLGETFLLSAGIIGVLTIL
jgi:hypothetical protein